MTISRDFQGPRPRRGIGIARPRRDRDETETLQNVSRDRDTLAILVGQQLVGQVNKINKRATKPGFPVHMKGLPNLGI